MSDHSIYVGFYIKIFNPRKLIDHEINTCPDVNCKNYEETNAYGFQIGGFCAKCGSSVKSRIVQRLGQLKFDAYKEFKDRMVQAFTEYKPEELRDYSIFIPNQGGFGHIIELYDTGETPIGSEDISHGALAFSTAFSKEIDKLVEVFGDENIRLRYGILNY